MITKEHCIKKTCLFCASDYHLEMILLPYLKERIDDSNIIITENNLEESINVLLTKINLDEKYKEKIRGLNWKNTNDLKFEEINSVKDKNVNIIINGSYNYIELINNKIKEFVKRDIEIVDCIHIDDSDLNMTEISKKYESFLNTQKL